MTKGYLHHPIDLLPLNWSTTFISMLDDRLELNVIASNKSRHRH